MWQSPPVQIEIAWLEARLRRDHVREQCVAGDFERHAEEQSALRWYSWHDSLPSAT